MRKEGVDRLPDACQGLEGGDVLEYSLHTTAHIRDTPRAQSHQEANTMEYAHSFCKLISDLNTIGGVWSSTSKP